MKEAIQFEDKDGNKKAIMKKAIFTSLIAGIVLTVACFPDILTTKYKSFGEFLDNLPYLIF